MYIAKMSGTNRQAARRRMVSASTVLFCIVPQPLGPSLIQDRADYKQPGLQRQDVPQVFDNERNCCHLGYDLLSMRLFSIDPPLNGCGRPGPPYGGLRMVRVPGEPKRKSGSIPSSLRSQRKGTLDGSL